MDGEKPPRAYLPRQAAASAIDWEQPEGSPPLPAAGPLARLSVIMASVRRSLVGLPASDEENGAVAGPSRKRSTVVYYADDTLGSSSEDDAKKNKGKVGAATGQSLRYVSSLESLSAVQQRRREQDQQGQQQYGQDDDGTVGGGVASFLRPRRRVVLMAVAALLALILVLGLGVGLGLRARSQQLLLGETKPSSVPESPTTALPAHPSSPLTISNSTSSSSSSTSQTSASSLSSSTSSSTTSSSSSSSSASSSSSVLPVAAPTPSTPAPSPTQPVSQSPAPSAQPTAAPYTPPPPPPPADPTPVPVPVPVAPVAPVAGGGASFAGDVTFYTPGLGACGHYNSGSDIIVAVSGSRYDAAGAASGNSNPNANPLCGRRIRVSLSGGLGATVDATIVDRCTGCAYDDVDLSPSAFGQLAGASLGRARGSWFFLD